MKFDLDFNPIDISPVSENIGVGEINIPEMQLEVANYVYELNRVSMDYQKMCLNVSADNEVAKESEIRILHEGFVNQAWELIKDAYDKLLEMLSYLKRIITTNINKIIKRVKGLNGNYPKTIELYDVLADALVEATIFDTNNSSHINGMITNVFREFKIVEPVLNAIDKHPKMNESEIKRHITKIEEDIKMLNDLVRNYKNNPPKITVTLENDKQRDEIITELNNKKNGIEKTISRVEKLITIRKAKFKKDNAPDAYSNEGFYPYCNRIRSLFISYLIMQNDLLHARIMHLGTNLATLQNVSDKGPKNSNPALADHERANREFLNHEFQRQQQRDMEDAQRAHQQAMNMMNM